MPDPCVPIPVGDSSTVGSPAGVVNFAPANSPGKPAAIYRYTPHFRLLGFLHHLPSILAPDLVGERARRVLVALLWRAGKRGAGEGTRASEAMLWASGRTLDADARLSDKSTRRALEDLHAERLVRWRVVGVNQWLPGRKARARVPTRVVYVDVDEIARRLGLKVYQPPLPEEISTEVSASSDMVARNLHETVTPDRLETVTPDRLGTQDTTGNLGESGAPLKSRISVNCIKELLLHRGTGDTDAPASGIATAAGVVVVDSSTMSPEAEIAELWRERCCPTARRGQVTAVTNAVRRAIAQGAEIDDLRATVLGAAHPEIGRYVRSRRVRGPSLFVNNRGALSGCLLQLSEDWREHQEAVARRAARALPSSKAYEGRTTTPPTVADAPTGVYELRDQAQLSAALARGDFREAQRLAALAADTSAGDAPPKSSATRGTWDLQAAASLDDLDDVDAFYWAPDDGHPGGATMRGDPDDGSSGV